jgi:hypothetical protein
MDTDKTGEPEGILEDGLAEAVARWRLGDTGSQRLDEVVPVNIVQKNVVAPVHAAHHMT